MGRMVNKERAEEREARGLVEVALGVTLEFTDESGDADYGFTTVAGQRAALEVTTVTSQKNKVARARWAKESPEYGPARTLRQCWDIWLDDIDVNYRGLVERLEPQLVVLETCGRAFESNRWHEFIGSPADEQAAARSLRREHVARASPFPELCNAEGPEHAHRIEVVRTSGWSASGSDAALALIEEDLNGHVDNGQKLRDAEEKHLFVWVDCETDMSVARPFRGGQAAQWDHFGLPTRTPELDTPVDQLWIVDRITSTGWIWNPSGWTAFDASEGGSSTSA